LFAATHEPTAMALSWTLLMLDQHSDRLEEIQAELDEVLAERPPTRADLPVLGKLDRAVKETLRLLPPRPVLGFRVVHDPVELEGVTLPVEANVVVSPLATHHDGARFPNPRTFDPDRWFALSPAPFTYLPYGAGPHACLAQAFADQTVRLMLARILQQRRLRCQPGTRIDRQVRGTVLRFKHGLPMRITRPKDPTDPPHRVRGDLHQLVELP
ncbi:MAG: cytochrome P450, partial [Myxococcota bacterium]